LTGTVTMNEELFKRTDPEAFKRYQAEQNAYPKVDGVNYDTNHRWENGIDHHEKSTKLFIKISEIDWLFNSDQFCWKSGGDGDNGESLMYLLDIIFDEQDQIDRNGNET